MSDVSIKVSIAGRVYPLTVNQEEEQLIANAAEKVENSILKFQESYSVRDKQDLLAMTALQMATSAMKNTSNSSSDTSVNSLEDLKDLEKSLDSFLSD